MQEQIAQLEKEVNAGKLSDSVLNDYSDIFADTYRVDVNNPEQLKALKTSLRKIISKVHPDHGGVNEFAVAVNDVLSALNTKNGIAIKARLVDLKNVLKESTAALDSKIKELDKLKVQAQKMADAAQDAQKANAERAKREEEAKRVQEELRAERERKAEEANAERARRAKEAERAREARKAEQARQAEEVRRTREARKSQRTNRRENVNASTADYKMQKGSAVEVSLDTQIRLANKVDINLADFKDKINALKDGESFFIGRTVSGPNDVRIANPYVSGTHLKVEKINGKIVITDMDSTNGTILNTTQPDYAAAYNPSDLAQKFGTTNYSVFSKLYNDNYDNLRMASYSPESSFKHSTMSQIDDTVSPGIHPSGTFVTFGNGWSWRILDNGCKRAARDRVSLNVVADTRMIDELDRLLCKGEFIDKNGKLIKLSDDALTKGYYKTPQNANEWLTRHDPITMYFDTKVSPEMLDAIAQVTEKYARTPSNGKALMNSLEGKPWIANEIYTPQNEIVALYNRARGLNRDLATLIYNEANQHGSWNVSTGMYAALEKLVNEYEMYRQMF